MPPISIRLVALVLVLADVLPNSEMSPASRSRPALHQPPLLMQEQALSTPALGVLHPFQEPAPRANMLSQLGTTVSAPAPYKAAAALFQSLQDSPEGRHERDAALADFILSPLSSSVLPASIHPRGIEWFPGAKPHLQKTMPTLVAIFSTPESVQRLLYILSLLRLQQPYQEGLTTKSAQWEIRLRELTLSPFTGSFRRHLLKVETPQGPYAIELKIPGEEPNRLHLPRTSFSLSKKLWKAFGPESGVVKPLFFAQFVGHMPLYRAASVQFSDFPLGIVAFEHPVTGPRANRVDGLALKRLALCNGISPLALKRTLTSDAFVAALRVTLQMQASLHYGKNRDGHPENVRIQQNGRAVLVGDFDTGHIVRQNPTPMRPVQEALELIGAETWINGLLGLNGPLPYLVWDAHVIRRVLRRLLRFVEHPQERLQLASSILDHLDTLTILGEAGWSYTALRDFLRARSTDREPGPFPCFSSARDRSLLKVLLPRSA